MGKVADELMAKATDKDRFAASHDELKETQVAALQERFAERRGAIKLLDHRASEAGIDQVASLADIVPLLFPHTAYKSYPESFLAKQRWDRMGKWLGTIATEHAPVLDPAGVSDIDDWIAQLEAHEFYLSCSSGTTGKNAMLPASKQDMDWSRVDTVQAFAWGSGVEPAQDRRIMGLAPVASVPKNRIIGEAQRAAYGDPDREPFTYPVPPLTVGTLTGMVVMRKAIAEGTAMPDEVEAFERTSAERAQIMEDAVGIAAERLIEVREEKLMISGMWNSLWQVAKAVRERGYDAKDFHPDNCIYVGGGLKRARLPDDYQEYVHQTFNIPAGRHFQNYSMQELNSAMPKCREGGRYHLPPWIVPLVLDEAGEQLVEGHGEGEVTGRAAFFDISLHGRWGGVISGDRISLDFGPCACGNAGPSVRDDIVRYADIQGDDKIGCAGTVDAYVRGVS